MKRVEFHPEAEAELEASVSYYEECAPGLGVDLRKQVEIAVKKILVAPERWMAGSKRTRRFLIRRFPYRIIYLEPLEIIVVVAVAHGKRRPGYWNHRITPIL